MGGVATFAKKSWSTIKNTGKAVCNCAKAVVKTVEGVTKIIVNGVITVVTVVAAIVTAAVIIAALGIGLGLLIIGVFLLSVIFISSLIKFGRTDENVEENETENVTENDNINTFASLNENKPNFEEMPKKKKLNMKGDFEKDFNSYFDEAKKRNEMPKGFTYSFEKDDKTNECLSTRRKENEVDETDE